MQRLLFLSLILLIGTSFMPPPKESFEGIITYKITFVSKLGDEEYTKYQSQKVGKTLVLTQYKNGNFKREYPSSHIIYGTEFSIYMQSVNRLYTKNRNGDTIKASDASKNTLIQKEESEKPNETIKGVDCRSYFISGNDSRNKQLSSFTYYYPVNKEFMDWKPYANFNDMFYNKVIFKIQAPFYKLIISLPKFDIIYELEKIEAKKLTEEPLKFPKGKPVKEL